MLRSGGLREILWLAALSGFSIAAGLAGLSEGAQRTAIEGAALEEPLRVFGTVEEASGQPLANHLVRWIPASAGSLSFHTHDGQAVGEHIDLERLPEGSLREALKQSLAVRTDPQGRYEMQVARPGKAGVVVASGEGWETALREVRFSEGDAASSGQPADRELSFRLSPAGRITGRVLEGVEGLPAAGTVVQAAALQVDRPAFYASFQDQAATMVSEDGSYALEGLAAGVYRVRPVTGYGNSVSYSDKQGSKAVLESGGTVEGLDFQVQPGGTIRGRVIGPENQPLSDVRLRVRMPLDARGWGEMLYKPSVRSDRRGEFEFRGLRLGQVYRLVASRSGFAQTLGEWIELMPNSPDASVEVRLNQGYSISGHVRLESGQPASGYRVRAFPTETDYRSRETLADESGAFVLANLPPGGFRLQASPAHVRPIIRSGPQVLHVQLDQGDLSDLEISVPSGPAHRLSGQALDDRGHAVADAWIQVSDGHGERNAQSGPDGRFAFDGLLRGQYLVRANKDGHSQALARDVAAGRDNLILTLPRNGWVSGRVVDWEGSAPGSPGQVEAVPSGLSDWDYRGLGGRRGWRGQSLSDGSFRIPAPAGKIEIRAALPDRPPAVSSPFQLEPGQEVSDIVIRLLPAGAVRGRVVREDESAVEDAEVSMLPVEPKLSEQSARWRLMQGNFASERHRIGTDRQGRFELSGLAEGDYWLLANHPRLVPSELRAVTVAKGEVADILDLILEPGGTISGQVSDGDQGLAGVGVQLMGMGDERKAVTDGEGVFLFQGVLPGNYHLYLQSLSDYRQGMRNAISRSIAVTSRQTLEVDIDYQKGGRLLGTVSGLPPARSRTISLTPAQRPVRFPRTQAYLRPDGSFDLRGIEPGRYLVEVHSTHSQPGDTYGQFNLSFKRHYRKIIEVGPGDTSLDIDLDAGNQP